MDKADALKLARTVEKFKLLQKCVHCKRNFNIYRLSRDVTEEITSDSTLSLPLLLVCGHSACEKCVYEDGKTDSCDECKQRYEFDDEKWDNPYDLGLIEKNKERIRELLDESEQGLRNTLNLLEAGVRREEINICAVMTAINHKLEKVSQDLKPLENVVTKIYELAEIRTRENDVPNMLRKLQLAKSVFESHAKLKNKLTTDLRQFKFITNDALIEPRIPNFSATIMTFATIGDLCRQGLEIVIGRRINEELYWAPVRLGFKYFYISSFSNDYIPSETATLIQHSWIEQISKENLPEYVFLEFQVKNALYKFKLIIKVREFENEKGTTLSNPYPKIALQFSYSCSGENGISYVGSIMKSSASTMIVIAPHSQNLNQSSFRDGALLQEVLSAGMICQDGSIKGPARFFISADTSPALLLKRTVFARVECGVRHLSKLCLEKVTHCNKYDQAFIFNDLRREAPGISSENKIITTDCGLFFKSS